MPTNTPIATVDIIAELVGGAVYVTSPDVPGLHLGATSLDGGLEQDIRFYQSTL